MRFLSWHVTRLNVGPFQRGIDFDDPEAGFKEETKSEMKVGAVHLIVLLVR